MTMIAKNDFVKSIRKSKNDQKEVLKTKLDCSPLAVPS